MLVEALQAARWTGRRVPTPMDSVSFGISRRDGIRRIGSSPCATRRSAAPAPTSLNNTNCLNMRNTPTAPSPPTFRGPIDALASFYNRRAGAENLIKEANNDAGLTAHPSAIWAMNCIHFQMAMLAYNLNCWLALFSREEKAKVETMKHTTLATSRLRFLFLAAKTWRHAGRVGVSYSDHYAEKGILERLMNRLRAIIEGPKGFAPVIASALRR